MKKITLFTLFATIVGAIFSSCKKVHTCTCTITNTTKYDSTYTYGYYQNQTSTQTKGYSRKETKNNAEAWCDAKNAYSNTNYGYVEYTYETVCELDN